MALGGQQSWSTKISQKQMTQKIATNKFAVSYN